MRGESRLPRLTLDTNSVISGAISPGNYCSELLDLYTTGAYIWIQTPQTFAELTEVLQRKKFKLKYGINKDEARVFLDGLERGSKFVTPLPIAKLPVHSRDEKDDKFLACAFSGACDYLISEDEDLLVLNGRPELGKLKIISAQEYVTNGGVGV